MKETAGLLLLVLPARLPVVLPAVLAVVLLARDMMGGSEEIVGSGSLGHNVVMSSHWKAKSNNIIKNARILRSMTGMRWSICQIAS